MSDIRTYTFSRAHEVRVKLSKTVESVIFTGMQAHTYRHGLHYLKLLSKVCNPPPRRNTMPQEQPKPIATSVESLANVIFRTALDADNCTTPAFFANIPFDRATGKSPTGFFMNGLNAKGFDEQGYDRQGFDDSGLNRNGYDKGGEFKGTCNKLHDIPKIPGAD